jgi:hypothetical protein
MSSRTVVMLKSADFYTLEENVEGEEIVPEIVSAEVGEQQITVYPNPTKGRILVEIQPLNYEENNVMRLFNSQGQLIETVRLTSEQTTLEIQGSSGVYLLDIHLGNNISRWKIIKQ